MCDSYNGWSNRETWATGLHINNDQGWLETIHGVLTAAADRRQQDDTRPLAAREAADIIREQVESVVTVDGYREMTGEDCLPASLSRIAEDIGSLYRVDWYELAEAFLSDIAEDQS